MVATLNQEVSLNPQYNFMKQGLSSRKGYNIGSASYHGTVGDCLPAQNLGFLICKMGALLSHMACTHIVCLACGQCSRKGSCMAATVRIFVSGIACEHDSSCIAFHSWQRHRCYSTLGSLCQVHPFSFCVTQPWAAWKPQITASLCGTSPGVSVTHLCSIL